MEMNKHQKICFNKLSAIPKGSALSISDVAKTNPDYFISLTKQIIDMGCGQFEFSNDYTKVKHLDINFEEWQK